MNYTLHQLKIFYTIYRLKSITKASEELFLTQPAVSIQLKKLQDQFEIPLTEVVSRQLFITDFGEQIAKASERILEEADMIKTLADQYKGLLSGKIRISSVSTGKYVLPYFLRGFSEQHPKVQLSIDVTNKKQVIESLAANTTDFGLVSLIPDGLALETYNLLENRLYLIGSSALDAKSITTENLGNHRLIFREEGSATRMAMENYLLEHGVKKGETMELVSNEAVKQAVNAGLGLSVMPLIGIRNELKVGDLQIISLPGLPIVTRWNLVHRTNKKLSPINQAMVNYIEEHKAGIVSEHFSWIKEV